MLSAEAFHPWSHRQIGLTGTLISELVAGKLVRQGFRRSWLGASSIHGQFLARAAVARRNDLFKVAEASQKQNRVRDARIFAFK
jgi:hypothetical protein